jgi:DNA-binding CsgD family transcriptional regulator
MQVDTVPTLAPARGAYARRAWADAFELFRRADEIAPLGIDDLERLMWSAGMLDRDSELFAACERLFNACAEAGRHDRAAHWAFFHAFRLFALREQGRATAWMQRAQQHAERFGGECAARGYLLLPVAMKHLATGDFAAAAENAAEALAVGERCREVDLAAFAKCLLGRAWVRQGKVDEGVGMLDAAMLVAVGGVLSPIITGLIYCNLIATCRQVYALDRSREWTGVLSEWCQSQPQLIQFNGLCRLHRAEILEVNGAWQEAIAEARRATNSHAHAHALAAETQAGAAYQEAEIHRLRGEFGAAEDRYREASRLGLEPQPGMALLRLAQGQGAQAAATLRRVLAATVDPLGRARLLPAIVEIMLAIDSADEAREAAAELEQIAGRFATAILSAMACQARGEVELAGGQPAAALGHLRAALATWQEAGAPYLAARLRVRLGRACRFLGDEDGARLEFDSARGAFERLGAASDLAQLEALSAAAPAAAAAPAGNGLTQREIQVLGLVAAGKTNKRIALDLGLSEKTIDRHVSNIFVKLGVASRAAATAFAYRHGLL